MANRSINRMARLARRRIGSVALAVVAIITILGGSILGYQTFSSARVAHASSSLTEPVLFIHGYNKGTSPHLDCLSSTSGGSIGSYLRSNGFTGDYITIGYYNGDTCDVNLSQGTNAVDPGVGRCTDYVGKAGATATDVGTDYESLGFIGCKLAWYIYDEYTNLGVTVRVVAHSMGGLLIRWALHCVSVNIAQLTHAECNGFPPRLNVSQVITIATPHGGTPNLTNVNASIFACPNLSDCRQSDDMQGIAPDPSFLSEMKKDTSYGLVPGGNGYGSTPWLLMSSYCDTWLDGVQHDAAMNFSASPYVTKYEYVDKVYPSTLKNAPQCKVIPIVYNSPTVYTYHHGDYLTDTSNSADADADYCVGCANEPTSLQHYQYHSIRVVCRTLQICDLPTPTPTSTRVPPTATPVPPTATPSGGHYEGNRVTSTWAGWEAVNWHAYSYARASWVLPSIPARNYSDMTMWVGYNGDTNEVGSSAGYLARVGVDASVDDVGDIYYSAFWEVRDTSGNIIAQNQDFYPNSLAAGQKVSVNVWYDGNTLHFDFTDNSTGWSNSSTSHTYYAPSWQEYTTDWMVSNEGRYLANWNGSGFTMTNCTASPNNANWYSINANAYYSDSMQNSALIGSASAGSLTAGGTQFSPVYI